MFPQIHLDAQHDAPIYRQLADQVRRAIERGRMQSGEKLPPTRELAGLLGLNRTTVSAAYELLETEGWIRGHVGRGSFVANEAARRIEWESLLGPLEPAAASAPGAGVISFATSRPSETLFPMAEFRATCAEVLNGPEAPDILQLGSPAGYAPLREYLLEDARRRGVARAGDDIAITSGCQQALDLLRRVLAPGGETVLIEDPVYPGLRNVLHGVRQAGLPVGPQGIDPEALEAAIDRERPRMLIVTPDFQNPTGASLPVSARQSIVRLAGARGVVLIENDVYSELRYEGHAAPTLKQLDAGGDVIHIGSFSKIAFPGLRVGWVIGARPLIAHLVRAKHWCDLHTDQLSQAVLLKFAQSGRLAAHRERMLAAGAARLKEVLAGCEKYLPAGARFTRPQGGMNLWVTLPAPLDAGELLARAQKEGVTYLPGRYFAVNRPAANCLRLSFAGLTPAEIRAGLKTLGRVFEEELERARAAWSGEPAPAMV